MIKNLFPSQIWSCNLNVESSIKDQILNSIEDEYQKNKSYLHPNWACKVYSSILQNNPTINYSKIIPYFKEQYEKFTNAINLKQHSYDIPSIWYNYYMMGYNQEMHDHIGGNNIYSAVYFLKLNKDHPSITFFNYTNCYTFFSCQEHMKKIYRLKDINHSITTNYYTLDVVEDSFVIFPSYMPHGVFVQKTNEPRITISMNFTLENNNGSAY